MKPLGASSRSNRLKCEGSFRPFFLGPGPRHPAPLSNRRSFVLGDRPSAPKIVRKGNDVQVTPQYRDPESAAGRAQGVALELGKGRVVVLAEAAMMTAQVGQDGHPFGMNVPGNDDRQLAVNILHWLSRLD
jgi:hypothetical protein